MPCPRPMYVDPMVRPATTMSVIAIALLVAGCAAYPTAPVQTNVTPFGRDVTLIYVPGIGGVTNDDRGWLKGLRAGGYEGKAEAWDWTGGLGSVEALWAHGRQRAEARHISDRIRQVRSESQTAPIVLVGHSAGAGVAVNALEDLPPGVRVDELVLLAPALSRGYDLTGALRRVRGRADVFDSDRDTLVLAIGTFLFGTVDGAHAEAAGHGGFVEPPGADPRAYGKLHTHPYSRDRQRAGDDGGHEGVLAPRVAAAMIAPLLTESRHSDGQVAVAEP